ncbi:DUF2867 domain-containing protein [Pseudofrankia sp. BMG5.37]|uniref:DUF2867 domain-containing protein n=1 Tax=Pseudofrankia sp. BMG5.37 TaxID=3050035 RepID=UPI0028944493|nr:DUF2867 domain-containing protein [Pseudofrankia sp. BMG5.37]MDT3438830.1 DUF2867 domain-containing protein [Pseudofrankia sp. BMG5.37]
MRCVVVGATGYVGSRLVPELLDRGHSVRAGARNPAKLADAPWRHRAELVAADLTDADQIAAALAGQDVLYYLVHSLHQRDFVERDRAAAHTVADAARRAGVRRIIYLGGISPSGQELSPHLASRAEVGRILLDSGVPTVVLRAAVIIGSGSASFEMLRYLTERLPVMITPRWVRTRVQPIAIQDVLYYLTRTADLMPAEVSRGFDIGGPEVLTYWEMMRRYAAVAGLPRRVVVPVPLLTPWLSAQWVNLVTPVPHSIAVPLISSLVHEVRCHDRDIAAHVPDPARGLIDYDQAVSLALARTRETAVPSHSSRATAQAGPPRPPSDPLPTDPDWSGGTVYQDVRELATAADAERLWQAIETVGYEYGWCPLPVTWSPRRWIDRLVGGVGTRQREQVAHGQDGQGGPHRQGGLRVGETLDWWRVDDVERPRRLRLRPRLRLPGRAWLELSAAPSAQGSVYRQRAIFEPHGLAGHLCWKSLAPLHGVTLGRMARDITDLAEHPAPTWQSAWQSW